MITQIEINRPGYKNFVLSELTKNNIFLFSSSSLKNKVTTTIEQIWLTQDNGDESVLYGLLSPEDTPELNKDKINLQTLSTSIVNLTDDQRFIFTSEPAFIYAAKDWYDVWFILEDEDKISCYALCEFIGSDKDWEKGLDVIYKNLLDGHYGNYGKTIINSKGGKHYAGISEGL